MIEIFEPGLALGLAGLLAVAHLLAEELEEYIDGYREQLVSFTAGVSISYIFIQLLPEFQRLSSEASDLIFAFPLFGFSSIHLLEKYIAKSDINGDQMRKDYAEIHLGFLILYHGTLGYLIAFILSTDTVSGLLFFVPILLHVAISSFSISELHEKFTSKTSVKALSSLAPLAGVLFHVFELISQSLFVPVFGTAIGMFFYVGVRDSIPNGDKGRPLEYLLGILLYLGVVFVATAAF